MSSDPHATPSATATAAEGVTDLLGMLALAEIIAFERLVEDAKLAPTLADRAALAELATAEYHHFVLLRGRLTDHGVDPFAAMEPFTGALESFHRRTPPADWLEAMVKAYVGNGIATDFYREVAEFVDEDTRALVHEVLADTGHAEFAVERVRAGIAADPRVGGRLALWGRRLMGEMLSQANQVAAERPGLAALLFEGTGGAPQKLFGRLTTGHSRRMVSLGLTP